MSPFYFNLLTFQYELESLRIDKYYLSSKSNSLAISGHGGVSFSSARNFLNAAITDGNSKISHLIASKDFPE
jgi:hypothetical protein